MTKTGELIRQSRVSMRLRQITLAKHLGFSNVFMSRIEKGAARLPTKYLDKTCEFLNLKRKDLLKAMEADVTEKFHRDLVP